VRAAATAQYRDRPVPRPHSHRHRHRHRPAMDPNAERLASGASAGPSHASPYNLRARGPARRPAPASDSSESSGSSGDEARSPQQQAEQVRDGLRDLGFQLKDLNADQPGQPPAWVFWHPELFLEDQVTAIKAQLDKALGHFQRLPPEQLTERFRKPSGAVGHHFIVVDKTACDLPGARMAIELIKQRLAATLFACMLACQLFAQPGPRWQSVPGRGPRRAPGSGRSTGQRGGAHRKAPLRPLHVSRRRSHHPQGGQ
jgi:hypothetical protein